jgi:hypothetical protein
MWQQDKRHRNGAAAARGSPGPRPRRRGRARNSVVVTVTATPTSVWWLRAVPPATLYVCWAGARSEVVAIDLGRARAGAVLCSPIN